MRRRRPSFSLALALCLASWTCDSASDASLSATKPTAGACPLTDPCQASAKLNLAKGVCQYTAVADGSPCRQNDACIANAACLSGKCVGTLTKCTARGPCYLSNSCDPDRGCTDVLLDGPCSPDLAPAIMTGCSSIDYAAPVTLGNTTVDLIVDSGSTTLAAASDQCESGCEGLSPVYPVDTAALASLSSGALNARRAGSSYGDNSSWSGVLVQDSLTIAGIKLRDPFVFAAMSYASDSDSSRGTTAFFTTDLCSGKLASNTRQGIIGLGNSPLAIKNSSALMDELADSGVTNAFSTQLCDTAGRLWLGGYDPAYVEGAFQYTPFTDASDGFYHVDLVDIAVDGVSIGSSRANYGVIIADNGTSSTQLPSAVYNKVVAALGVNAKFVAQFPVSMLSSSPGCYSPDNGSLSREDLDGLLPSFSMFFTDAVTGKAFELKLPPTASYLTAVNYSDGSVIYCPAMSGSGALGTNGSPDTILGNSMMRAHVVTFDREHRRLGFANQQNCLGPDY